MHSIHLDLDLNLSVSSLFCVIFLMENYEESIQEQSNSRAMAFWGHLVMVKVQHGETLRHFLLHGTLRKPNVLPPSHLFVPVAVNKQI